MSNLNKNFKIFKNDIYWVDQLYVNKNRVKSICNCKQKKPKPEPDPPLNTQIPINNVNLLSDTILTLNKGIYCIKNISSLDIQVTINNIEKDLMSGNNFKFAIDDNNEIIEL